MFRLTAETEYGYLALVRLTEAHGSGQVVKLSEIIADKGLSEKFMLQVLTELRRAGLVESRRGKHGGYVLARDPETVTLADLLAATTAQSGSGAPAIAGANSFLARWWRAVLDDLDKRGRKTSLAQAVAAEKGSGEHMYYI